MSAVPTLTIGTPRDPAAVRSITVDDVVVTYLVDGVLTISAAEFFPAVPTDAWEQACTAGGDLLMSTGGLLIQSADRTVLIDAGVGPMTTKFATGSANCGFMLNSMAALGVRPDDVDVVAFTHLHFDHSGWAFVGEARTFPKARYAIAAQEWSSYDGEVGETEWTSPHVINQLRCQTGGLDLFADEDEIVPGIRALVSGGHTPGHTAFVFTSRWGRRLIAFGDAFHNQIQMAQPDWLSIADSDSSSVIAARHRLLARLSEPNTIGFGAHFGDQPFGRVVADARGNATWEPVPSTVLAPPPR